MKLLLSGCIGSGHVMLAERLEENYGLHYVRTYTTRPKLDSDKQDLHIYINEADIANYPDRCMETEFDGYKYFITERQLEENDVVIIPPSQITELAKNHPSMGFSLICVVPDAEEGTLKAISGLDEETYERRHKLEETEINEFYANMQLDDNSYINSLPENIVTALVVNNNFTPDFNDCIEQAANTYIVHDNLLFMTAFAIKNEIIPVDENGEIFVMIAGEDATPKKMTIPVDVFVLKLLSREYAPMFQMIVTAFLTQCWDHREKHPLDKSQEEQSNDK